MPKPKQPKPKQPKPKQPKPSVEKLRDEATKAIQAWYHAMVSEATEAFRERDNRDSPMNIDEFLSVSEYGFKPYLSLLVLAASNHRATVEEDLENEPRYGEIALECLARDMRDIF